MTSNAERVGRALLHLEEHLFGDLALADLAATACLSPFHFHRLFTAMVGRPPGEHIRRRRLTVAARQLVTSERPIVQLAFDSGFSSQEAFTRAFERQHGVPPGAFRRRGLPPTAVQPPITPDTLEHLMQNVTREPRMVELPAFHTVGMARVYDPTQPNDIPALWSAFAPRIAEIPHVIPGVTYGVCSCTERLEGGSPGGGAAVGRDAVANPPPDGYAAASPGDAPPLFEYVAAVGVQRVNEIPDGMVAREIPAARYLVFTHSGHISKIKDTIDFVWGTWLPRSEHEPAPTPDFERYDERFDGRTGEGELEIWVPVSPEG